VIVAGGSGSVCVLSFTSLVPQATSLSLLSTFTVDVFILKKSVGTGPLLKGKLRLPSFSRITGAIIM